MKKFKLFTLSLLTLSAVGVLASCGANKQPPQKPDVYFRANSRVIVDSTGKTKAVDFKDEECAKIEVENKDNLQYGQDVVITITPKQFFTFREYDTEEWKPTPGSAPVRPYVGLGNPHSLYSYPLQEDLAWKFEDKTVESQDKPGYYKEEYKITVFGDFFQKNIVIDYGNVSVNNSIYAYTSSIYNEVFSDVSSLASSFGCDASGENNFYVLDKDYSAFTAAGKGVTVTYTFANQDNPFGFNGWDTADIPISNANSNKCKYEHFEVNGIKDGETPELLSIFDKDLRDDEQSFLASVSDDGKYISFFISWKALANPDDEYSTKFDKIEVKLKEPQVSCKNSFEIERGDMFKGDFFQYPNEHDKKPLTSVDKGRFETYLDSSKTSYKFYNALDVESLEENEHIQFATAFMLPEGEDGERFSVYLNEGSEALFNVSPENPGNKTEWRVPTEPKVSNDGESELSYWVSEGWHLVQLNPEERTTGFYNSADQLIHDFDKKGNIYFLYTTNLDNFGSGQVNFSVKLNPKPVQVTFSLDDTSKGYGKFENDDTTITMDVTCPDIDDEISIKFYPGDDYKFSGFIITLDDTAKNVFNTTYDPTAGNNYGIIKLIRGSTEAEIPSSITISLQQDNTSARLVGGTNELGLFVDENVGLVSVLSVADQIEEGSTSEIICKFEVDGRLKEKIIIDEKGTKTRSPDLVWQVKYNGTVIDPDTINVEPDQTALDGNILNITIPVDSSTIKQHGQTFEVYLAFMSISAKSEDIGGFEGIIDSQGTPLGQYVANKVNTITVNLIFKGTVPKEPMFTCKSMDGRFEVTPNRMDERTFELTITVQQGEIKNGTDIIIFVSEAVKA